MLQKCQNLHLYYDDLNDKTQIVFKKYYTTLHLKPRNYRKPRVIRNLYENLV